MGDHGGLQQACTTPRGIWMKININSELAEFHLMRKIMAEAAYCANKHLTIIITAQYKRLCSQPFRNIGIEMQ